MDFFSFQHRPQPALGPVPEQSVGLRLRVDLNGTSPPVWRRIEVSGETRLDIFHVLLQAAMGWSNYHLHRFSQGTRRDSPDFLTDFDVAEGASGIAETDVQLSQVLRESGDKLGYDYDFGDGWAHTIKLEKVLPTPPELPRCTKGRRACPPEDVGGVHAFEELSAWIRDGAPQDYEPYTFEQDIIQEWLPPNWHPDSFDEKAATEAMQAARTGRIQLAPKISELLATLPPTVEVGIRELLRDDAWSEHVPGEGVLEAEMLAPFATFVQTIGTGVKLTQTKQLPPAVLKEYAERSGIANWWPRALSSEANVAPVAEVHELARELGLVYVRKGILSPTFQARELADDPAAWSAFLSQKLPLGRSELDQSVGLATLLVAGSDIELEDWELAISDLLAALGWRTTMGGGMDLPPRPYNLTLDLLGIFVRGLDRAYLADPDTAPSEETLEGNRRIVAAFARQVVLGGN